MRQVLVVAQLGLSLTLLIGAGLLAKSFYGLRTMDPGFRAENVLTARIDVAGPSHRSLDRQREFMEKLIQDAGRLPGVEAASIGGIPLAGFAGNTSNFIVENRPLPPPGQAPNSAVVDVSMDYFRTLGVPLLQGRPLAATDSGDAPLVMVVNQAFARRVFPGESPLGHRVSTKSLNQGDRGWAEIVGVVGDIHQVGLDRDVPPSRYRTIQQEPDLILAPSNLLIRVSNDPAALISPPGKSGGGDRSGCTGVRCKTLEHRLDDSLGSRRFSAALTGAFALVAMFLASIGVYGVMSYLVTLRTSEIGIRLALGAQRGQVVGLIVREGVALGLIGVALGAGGALGLSRYLSALLYRLGTRDAETFGVAMLVLFGAVLAACYVRRPTRSSRRRSNSA